MKIFKNYPFENTDEINADISTLLKYYRLSKVEIGGRIVEVVENLYKEKVSLVTYKVDQNYKHFIQKYHEINYGTSTFQLEYKVGDSSYKLLDFNEGKCIRFYILMLDEKGWVKKDQWYDSDSNLLEYHEYFYDESGKIEKEKIFHPDRWEIYEERGN